MQSKGSNDDTTSGSMAAMLKKYVLAELRCALLRTRLAEADIEAIGIALTMDLIDVDTAMDAARETNAHHLGAPVPFIDDIWVIDPVEAI